jgi:hypothetical protein
MNLKDFPLHVQIKIREQIRRDDLRRVEANKPEPTIAPSLVSGDKEQGRSPGRIEISVVLVAILGRPMDDDNLVGSFKPLRDLIAEELGIDDGDERIRFSYGQVQSRGTQGVIVRVEIK